MYKASHDGSTAWPLAQFVALFVLLYAAYGAVSPFLPGLLESRGIGPEQIGLILLPARPRSSFPLRSWVGSVTAMQCEVALHPQQLSATVGNLLRQSPTT